MSLLGPGVASCVPAVTFACRFTRSAPEARIAVGPGPVDVSTSYTDGRMWLVGPESAPPATPATFACRATRTAPPGHRTSPPRRARLSRTQRRGDNEGDHHQDC